MSTSTASPIPSPTNRPSDTPSPVPLTSTLFDTMSLEEKVGQLFVIGFDGTEMNASLYAMVKDYGVGGVILFARNVASPEQVAQLTGDLQAVAREGGRPGLFIAIDQEGGRVARLTEATGFTEFPGAMAIGASGDVENARQVASAMAEEMRAVGINVDFAPDLDVNNNPNNPVIGLRSFGSDPQSVAQYGVAFMEGLQSGGIMAFGKHFPGHGDTDTDSHLALPVVPHDRDRLSQVEFVPFQAAMRHGIAGIMSAHVTFPAIEPDNLPATLSQRVMTGLIRDEMGYDNLLATDSLEMGALGTSGFPPALAAEKAFAAGADLLLFNRDHAMHRAAYAQILEQLRTGAIPISRLDAAVKRILSAKERYGLLKPPEADNQSLLRVDWEGHKALSRRVARAAVTLVSEETGILPLQPGGSVLVIEVPAASGAPGVPGIGERLQARQFKVTENPTPAEIEQALRMAKNSRQVIVTTSDAKTNPAQAALVNGLLKQGGPVIVVALRSPYDRMAFPTAKTFLATYGYNPPMLEALVDVVSGRVQASGRLPVTIPEP